MADRAVAGVKAPAFIERGTSKLLGTVGLILTGVAGVKAPAFIERSSDLKLFVKQAQGDALRG